MSSSSSSSAAAAAPLTGARRRKATDTTSKSRSSSVGSSTKGGAEKATTPSATARKKMHSRVASETDVKRLIFPATPAAGAAAKGAAAGSSDAAEEELTVVQLQGELRKHGAKVTGKKHELIERLREMKAQSSDAGSSRKAIELVVASEDAFNSGAARSKHFGGDENSAGAPNIPARRPVIAKATDTTTPPAVTVTTTTTVTGGAASAASSATSKDEGLKDGSSAPKPPTVPTSEPTKPLGQAPGPGAAPSAGPVVAGAALPPAPLPVDGRTLRVQYQGKGVDTIKFDVNDKMVVENVSAMLRNLFPDQKVNLDPKLDIEPVYLVDEYSELHVVTLDFLRLCPGPNDPPANVYQAKKGPLVQTVEDKTLQRYQFLLAVIATVVFVGSVSLVMSPRFLFGSLPRTGSASLVNALHDWAGLGYPASFFLSMIHFSSAFLVCAYLSPVYRVSIKLWYPRLLAMRVDVRKAWVAMKCSFEKRKQLFTTRLLGSGRPFPARLRLGHRNNWRWMITKRYLTTDLTTRVRSFLPEALIVSFVCYQLAWSGTTTGFLLIAALMRPSRQSLALFWGGELNAETMLWEMLFSSLALPGSETNLAQTPILGGPVGVQSAGSNDTTIKLKWNPPTEIPKVSTSSDRQYSVGVSRYIVDVITIGTNDPAGRPFSSYEVAAPNRDWSRRPRLDEAVFALTIVVQLFIIHPGLATLVGLVIMYSLITASDAGHKPQQMTIECLVPNTDYQLYVRGVDDLNRVGAASVALAVKTRPRTLFRRLLLASEEVGLKLPPAPAQAPATAPSSGAPKTTSTSPAVTSSVTTTTTAPAAAVSTSTTAVVPAAAPVPAPAPTAVVPPAPSVTKDHIRYAGVVWNLAMDDKETELFLRTMRSAMLPDPRKEKFEADFIFSTDSKSTHQVVSSSYLRTLASNAYQYGNRLWNWNADPILVVHPAGTRHTFAPESIYNHMVVSKQTVEWSLNIFVVGTLVSYFYMYSQQPPELLDEFWKQTYIDLLRTIIQLFVWSNAMVLVLKNLRANGASKAAARKTAMDAAIGSQVTNILVALSPDEFGRQVILATVTLALCSLTLLVTGATSFSGIATCLILLYIARTAGDGAAVQRRTDIYLSPLWNLTGPAARKNVINVISLVIGVTIFYSISNFIIGIPGAFVAFRFLRFALQAPPPQ